jgi:RNA polymerase sigma-70 factor (ECF subfamily)
VALPQRIQAGDKEAEVEFYQQFFPQLDTMLRKVTNTRQDAEDVLQEVMRLAIEKLRQGQIRNDNSLTGYVQQIGRYQAIEFYRKRRNLSYVEDPYEVSEESERSCTLCDEVMSQEQDGLVRNVIDGLKNNRDRILLRMVYLDEFSKNEVCDLLDLDQLHFNRVLYRAKSRFRALWIERMGEEKAAIS